MRISNEEIRNFQTMIFSWWQNNKRDLPWRYTHDPYKILVSECMLQQTQVSRVMAIYEIFLQTFPTIFDLSQASLAQVLIAWQGLGYNRRAKFLHQAAQKIVLDYQGEFPKDVSSLLSLPGVGTYTAHAILVFSFRKDVALLDTNIRKIIVYYFFKGKSTTDSILSNVAQQLVPKGKSWEWHQALMDFGSLVLPEVLKQNGIVIPVPKQSKFIGSRRYYRGKILNLLRIKSYSEHELLQTMHDTFHGDKQVILSCIVDLTNESLISKQTGDTYSLCQ